MVGVRREGGNQVVGKGERRCSNALKLWREQGNIAGINGKQNGEERYGIRGHWWARGDD